MESDVHICILSSSGRRRKRAHIAQPSQNVTSLRGGGRRDVSEMHAAAQAALSSTTQIIVDGLVSQMRGNQQTTNSSSSNTPRAIPSGMKQHADNI